MSAPPIGANLSEAMSSTEPRFAAASGRLASRQRVELALAHEVPDRVPLDLGASMTTGMHVSSVYKLRQGLGLDPPGTPVKVVEPFQMLGEIAPDLMDAVGVDVVRVGRRENLYGFRNENWKPWEAFGGIPMLVPGEFPTDRERSGDILMYPCADRTAPPCARMPKAGFYFDAIVRQDPIDETQLDPVDNTEEFEPISDADLEHIAAEVERLGETGRAIMLDPGGMGFGDVALVPGNALRHPKGIRDLEQWYMSLVSRPRYIYEVFDRQCEIALANLARIRTAIGDAVTAVFVTGTDFGGQEGPLISPKTYRNLFKPFHVRINEWIHANTAWKTFIHSCGSIWRLLDDIVDAGFDALNPVQTSAAGMDPAALKERYGDRVTFWGGGIDTQRVLPFGAPDEVRAMVHERMRIFGAGGGFVFNTIHNAQAGVPVENLLALYEAVEESRDYPIGGATK
jgi:Uroporphyrinogen decarboxylase (URO-D)